MLVQPTCTTRTTNPYARYLMSSANNKHSDFGLAMIMLYKITGKQIYKDIIRSTALDFKSKLIWQNGGEYYSWHYQDPFWYWDFENKILGGKPRHGVWIEHRSGYGGIDMKFMTECYRMGIVFCKKDVERCVKTNVEIMYNGGNWLKNDGSPPNTAASESGGPYAALSPYDGTSLLANLLYNSYNNNYTSYGARCGAPYLVYIMKIPPAELHPPDTMKWVGPLEAINLEVINRGAIKLTFYNEVDPTTVPDTANWDFSRGMSCIGAEMDPTSNYKVIVYSTEQVPEVNMKIRVRNVKDIYGNFTFAYPYSNQPYLWVSSTIPARIINPEFKLPAAQTFLRVGPNPAPDQVRIHFLADYGEEPVTLRIFNAHGQLVYSTVSGQPRHGENTLTWNRMTSHQGRASSGLYFVGISNQSKSITGKVLLAK
jgi:hypothetical protein